VFLVVIVARCLWSPLALIFFAGGCCAVVPGVVVADYLQRE
jgi:hypothetical protein